MMQFKKVDKDYFIYIEKDEMVMDSITKFCTDKGIRNAKLSGIGAVKHTEIGAYDTMAKEYIRKKIDEVLELISFEGNVTLKDDKPFVHAHVVLSNHEMSPLGGHLFETCKKHGPQILGPRILGPRFWGHGFWGHGSYDHGL